MNLFRRVTLRTKLLASLGVTGLLVAALLVLGDNTIRNASVRLENSLSTQVRPLVHLNRLQARINGIRVLEIELPHLGDFFAVNAQIELLRSERMLFARQLEELLAKRPDAGSSDARIIAETWQRYDENLSSITALAAAMNMEAVAKVSVYESAARFKALTSVLEAMAEQTEARASSSLAQTHDEHERQRQVFLAMSVAGLCLLALWLGLFARSLSGRLSALRDAAARVAEGARERPIDIGGNDELSDLGATFNSMQRKVQAREQALQERSAELLVSNRELEAFSYSVSHDLRAPLRSIDGFAQILEEDYVDRLDEVGRGHLARIRAASQRLAELIDDLLKLARVTRAEINKVKVDLSALARAVGQELNEHAAGRMLHFGVDEDLKARADPTLMRVVLENLLGNAWKFTRNRPEPHVEFGSTLENSETVFYVRDNGAGFDPQFGHKLFNTFQRLHRPDEFEGTGIGLATVARIVQRHGGRVWAKGELGRGATFYFTLS